MLSLGGGLGGMVKVSKTAMPMAESDKDAPCGIKALGIGSYVIDLVKQHANVFNFGTY